MHVLADVSAVPVQHNVAVSRADFGARPPWTVPYLPPFSHSRNGDNNSNTYIKVLLGDLNEVMYVKLLEQYLPNSERHVSVRYYDDSSRTVEDTRI